MDKLWILGRSSECQYSHRSESVVEQLKDASDANADDADSQVSMGKMTAGRCECGIFENYNDKQGCERS